MNLYANINKYNYIRYTIYSSSPAVPLLTYKLTKKAKKPKFKFRCFVLNYAVY